MRRSRLLWAQGLLVLFLSFTELAQAADLRVLCSQAFTEAMTEVIPIFEQESGHRVELAFGTTGALTGRVEKGEVVDVVILTRPALERLILLQRLTDERVEIARSLVGIATKPGSATPDLSSAENIKAFLLGAKSITYPDPSSGGASGVLFARFIEGLGIAQALQSKTRLVPGGVGVGELVARGEVEVGVAMISELKPVSGIHLVGPLPPSSQALTVFAAGFGLNSDPSAAHAFVNFLTSPATAHVLNSKGLEPISPGLPLLQHGTP